MAELEIRPQSRFEVHMKKTLGEPEEHSWGYSHRAFDRGGGYFDSNLLGYLSRVHCPAFLRYPSTLDWSPPFAAFSAPATAPIARSWSAVVASFLISIRKRS